MGERSQIYIRYNVNYMIGSLTENPEAHNYKGLIARYFQWNYGERMISRARYIIEEIKDEFLEYKWMFGNDERLEKLKRLCDVNFDIKDITLSSDIIKEVTEYDNVNVQDIIFNQPNNDGKFFIDVTDNGIKYCFMTSDNDGEPMNGENYMKWNCEGEDHPDWHVPYKYMKKNTILYTERNIKKIDKMATLMTKEEVRSFINDDYSYLIAPLF